MTEEAKRRLCIQYLQQESEEFCRYWVASSKNKSVFSKCNCCAWLSSPTKFDERDAIASFMLVWFDKSKTERQQTLIEWIRYTKELNYQRKFFTPLIDQRVDNAGAEAYTKKAKALSNYKICRTAIGFILDVSRSAWTTCCTALAKNQIPVHKSRNKSSGRGKQFNIFVKDALDEYMEEVATKAEEQSTRVVRDATGLVGLRDGEAGVLFLPPYMSKRKIYEEFCFKRGHLMTQTERGYTSTQVTDTADTILSWASFLSYWKKTYSHLRMGRSAEDICDSCHVFHNRFKFKAYRDQKKRDAMERAEEEDALLDKGEDSDMDDDFICRVVPSTPTKEGDEHCIAKFYGEEAYDEATDSFAPITVEDEDADDDNDLLAQATLHVKQANAQRDECNRKISEAEEDYAANKGHDQFRRCIVVDYSQNIGIPQVGKSQPGRSYYLSPLNVNVFGIVHCGIPGGTLDAFVYHEGQGGKGGDNVASMIMIYWRKQGWIQDVFADTFIPGQEVTVIMDNCPGQNKNNTVLRLANLLVQSGYFAKVNMLFYIAGHTKNACDRWFNTLKSLYRKSDIWTMDQLYRSLKTHNRITIHRIKEGDFKRYSAFLKLFYYNIPTGYCKLSHVFTVGRQYSSDSGEMMYIYTDKVPGTEEERKSKIRIERMAVKRLKPDGTEMTKEEQLGLLRSAVELESIPNPNIPEIKQVELYSKWRSIVPQRYWHLTCPVPTKIVIAKNKEKVNSKQRGRNTKKRALASSTSSSARPKTRARRKKKSAYEEELEERKLDDIFDAIEDTEVTVVGVRASV